MSEWGDIISRIFSSGRTQGLSGSAEAILDPDPASSFYASRLRKHVTDEDLIENCAVLWSSASFGGRKGGLLSHMQSDRTDAAASYTDALFVINQADAGRANAWSASHGNIPWAEQTGQQLGLLFEQATGKDGFRLPFASRILRFWFVADGSKEMHGQSFGLGPGEYVTGLLPNLYIGPGTNSRPVLAIHLNLPGVWEGYKEVGRLFNDQLLFTLGRHWLDNFHHPALREPGLYRLQQFTSGALVHEVSPELQDRYVVRSDKVEGASVITVSERRGRPVAFLVLAAIDEATHQANATPHIQAAELPPAGRPTTPTPPRAVARRPEPEAATIPLALTTQPTRDDHTIVPKETGARMLTIQERGALLQKVHFAAFMEGYDIYIGSNGQMATMLNNPRATIQIRGRRVLLLSQSDSVRVGGRRIDPGILVPLSGEMDIEVDGHPFHYRDLTETQAEGWPYLAEIRRPGTSSYLDFGGMARIGRDRRCKIRLPDEPHNDNISWLPSVDNGTSIRSRNGDIPKSRFYTDSIMVASEHLELDLSGEPLMRSMARNCFSFVRRAGRIISMAPRDNEKGLKEIPLQPGDEVLVGNCLFHVSWPPLENKNESRSAEKPPSFVGATDLPSAVGLGERGTAPRPLQLDALGQDSITAAPPIPAHPGKMPAAPPVVESLMIVPDDEDPVVWRDHAWCKNELSQSARLVNFGWVLTGDVVIGNHRDASLVVPELRVLADQSFLTLDYFRVQPPKNQEPPLIELLQFGEARLLEDGAEVERSVSPLKARLQILRRNEMFEPDFELSFLLSTTGLLPKGRCWLLQLDLTRPRAVDLFTTGLALHVSRMVRMANTDMMLRFDGSTLRISGYLPSTSSQLASGNGRSPMVSFPADGASVDLHPGDWLLVEGQLFCFQVCG